MDFKKNGGRSHGITEPDSPVILKEYSEQWTRRVIDPLELVTLRNQGMTYRGIAAHLGFGKTSVVHAMRRIRAKTQ